MAIGQRLTALVPAIKAIYLAEIVTAQLGWLAGSKSPCLPRENLKFGTKVRILKESNFSTLGWIFPKLALLVIATYNCYMNKLTLKIQR